MAGDMAQHTSGDAAVASSVHNLILAFTDGLNVFKRLKERRRRKKGTPKGHGSGGGNGGGKEVRDDAEKQLSSSLRRGPVELSNTYGRFHSEKGDDFARGDAIAQTSLAETLIKLNAGLVSIIAAFLYHESTHSHLKLDYKSLTTLSESSRREAMDSLNQLYFRLSQSQLQLQRMPSPSPQSNKPSRKRSTSRSGQRISAQRVSAPTVTRASIKNSNGQTQLVMVRPKNIRKSSTSSGSASERERSSNSNSTKSPPQPTSPQIGSPLPQYSQKDPYPRLKSPALKHQGATIAAAATGRKRADSFVDHRPSLWPYTKPADDLPTSTLPGSFPYSSPFAPIEPIVQPLAPTKKLPATPAAGTAVAKRRMDKQTFSTYTFASDSTKLGEIPQRNWTIPWNHEEAKRLNAVAAIEGVPIAVPGKGNGQKKARTGGFLGFLRRGSTST
ncbi:hypothetical protein P280DRAFT_469183 [Massarina eburnea CBS 473.64]|uniref:Uncharacterized protein n=1 Tax=Massarina eburnea CBS 473.64 TaxID=1395130 RepID=A0A6A6S5A0_9PLEO|nr:hypothetical protein P280DRAFT_469183 [Massarina eburnea CBS 473.64]